MNRQAVERNLANHALWEWYVRSECERLAERARHMEAHGIVRLVR